MSFVSMEQEYGYMSDCRQSCMYPPQENTCPTTYVDCSDFGGYDPNDPCKQTCLQTEDKYEVMSCQH